MVSDKIITFSASDARIGLRVRRASAALESLMVEDFLTWVPRGFETPGCRLAVFLEPEVAGNYPDAVIVAFRPNAYASWSPERSSLAHEDFKILLHASMCPTATIDCISRDLGYELAVVERAISKLEKGGLVYQRRGKLTVRALRRIFGIRRLVAVEVKERGWTIARRQAALNRWFASESYVLTGVVRPRSRTLDSLANLGIGAIAESKRGYRIIVPSSVSSLPRTYSAWLFNEWIGRALASTMKDSVTLD